MAVETSVGLISPPNCSTIVLRAANSIKEESEKGAFTMIGVEPKAAAVTFEINNEINPATIPIGMKPGPKGAKTKAPNAIALGKGMNAEVIPPIKSPLYFIIDTIIRVITSSP